VNGVYCYLQYTSLIAPRCPVIRMYSTRCLGKGVIGVSSTDSRDNLTTTPVQDLPANMSSEVDSHVTVDVSKFSLGVVQRLHRAVLRVMEFGQGEWRLPSRPVR
jgi:hypothetical protein